jgi:hypothetical protein
MPRSGPRQIYKYSTEFKLAAVRRRRGGHRSAQRSLHPYHPPACGRRYRPATPQVA